MAISRVEVVLPMRVLVIGSGGREHALVWTLKRSSFVKEIYSPSKNAGICSLARSIDVDQQDLSALAEFAASHRIDLTIVGPEQPLVDGIVDRFSERGLAIFGPSRAAAQLEGSKVFAKQFMQRNGIPTARSIVVGSAAEAFAAIDRGDFTYPFVLKAEGLAAGKGVIIAESKLRAKQAVEDLMITRTLGGAGSRLVLEECLSGRELSYLVFSDGVTYCAMPVAQDHKRALESDQGPNTGGMGAFSLPGLLEPEMEARIQREIVEPTLEGVRREGSPFCGVLYCGLMLNSDGPRVLEYNVRLGDPETQAILRRLDSDLTEICLSVAKAELSLCRPKWSPDVTTCVVMASAGYPGSYPTGRAITGLNEAEDVPGVVVFQAGTRAAQNGQVLTTGGRVLGVTARAASLEKATELAYQGVERIRFEGMHFRRDIGRNL